MAHHDSSGEIAFAGHKACARLASSLVVAGALGLGVALSGSLGAAALFYLGLAAFVAPGFFVSRLYFSGSERLLAGAAVGYLVSSLVASGLYRWGWFGTLPTAGACLVVALGLGLALGRRQSDTRSSAGRNEDVWIAAAMFVALALVAVPFLRVGEATAEGTAYRAYFSADLMTHLSVVAELQKGDFPPQNPFYTRDPLAYYWLFFLFPALAGKWIGNQQALLLTYVAGGLLFAGLAYTAARRLTSTPGRALVAVVAGLAASGYEGAAALVRAAVLGQPLSSFRDMNVDAFSRWVLELTSIDGLHRSLLYTPQHLFSYSLLLVLILLVLRGHPRGVGSSLLAGVVLGGMAGTSIVTAILAGPWLVLVRLRRTGALRQRARDLVAIGVPALACLALYLHLGFFGEAGSDLVLRHPRLLEIPILLLLEAGALSVLAIGALKDPRARPLALLAAMALAAVLGLDIRGYEGVWMAWRAGSVFLVCLLLMAGRGMEAWPGRAVALVILPASITAILDVYNAQDVTNRGVSAGEFRWTTVVSRSEMQALSWLRSETVPRAVVQWDVRAREPGEWAIIPALAERRMAVGFPIFLLDREKYRIRERRWVRPLFTTEDPTEAHRLAVRNGIDYIFVGRRELEVRGERLRKLWESPDRFRQVFSDRDTTIFQVLR